MGELIAVLAFVWIVVVMFKKIVSNIMVVKSVFMGEQTKVDGGDGYADIPNEDEFLRKNDGEDWLK